MPVVYHIPAPPAHYVARTAEIPQVNTQSGRRGQVPHCSNCKGKHFRCSISLTSTQLSTCQKDCNEELRMVQKAWKSVEMHEKRYGQILGRSTSGAECLLMCRDDWNLLEGLLRECGVKSTIAVPTLGGTTQCRWRSKRTGNLETNSG